MSRRAPRLETLRLVLRNVGTLLAYVAALPLALVPVAIWHEEPRALRWALAMSATFLVAGMLLSRLPAHREPRLREGMLVAAVGWLVIPLGSIVLLVGAEGWRPLDAFFETMSAWTGTGISFAKVSTLSHTTLFWRSLMQWVGGLGVVVLSLAILARPGTGAYTLYVSEAREEKLRPSILGTVRTLWGIYVALTVAAILLLLSAGLPVWDAVNVGLTSIATGGMTVTDGGIAEYASPAVEWAVIAIMIAGALPFVAIYALAHRRWGGFFRDEQVRAFAWGVGLALPLLAWALLRGPLQGEAAEAVRTAAFQVTSGLTSAGFQTTTFAEWPPVLKFGLGGIMVLGGAAGSTAGGLKLVRAVLLIKGALWKLRRSGLPSFAVTAFRFGGERLHEQEANEEFAEASFILVLWIGLLLTTTLVLVAMLPDAATADLVFDVASVQGNNGMTTGLITPALPDAAKVALLVQMWAARLEILPALLLLRALLPLPHKH